MKRRVKLVHHYRDVIDSWDQSPFVDVQEAQIDEASYTISDVCVFGTRHSLNGYDYEDPAIDKLTMLTEGAKFFVNHPSKSEYKDRDGVRDIRDWAGVYGSPRKQGADKVYATLRVRPAFWELVKDVAMMKPPGVGNSINSRVKVYKDQKTGKEHIVDIDVLRSIDLVASAATTQNLFESHGDDMETDIGEIIDQLLLEEEGKSREDMTYQLVRDSLEGILADKIKEKEKERKIRDLQWNVEDTIADVLKDEAKDMKTKKSDIGKILDDFETMINDILAGKKVPNVAENEKKEEEDMDFGKLTLEELTKERPDLVKVIQDGIKSSEEMATIRKEHEEMKTQLEALTKERDEMKTQLEALKKEKEDLQKKVDEFETKEKGAKKEAFISQKASELKVPKDAMTDVFRGTLMTMEEKEIEEALKDRRDVYLKGAKIVRNAGEEFGMDQDEETAEEAQKKKDAASKSLQESVGQ